MPDKKNYTIEELGLSPEAARNLYTGRVNSRVINLLLSHPDFATLTDRIADYWDDTLAAGIAAQNQLYDSVSKLMMRISKEDKALRQAAAKQAREAKSLRRNLYADELAQIDSLFKSILSAIKKANPTGKPEAAKAMTKQGFAQMEAELIKGGDASSILKVTPEMITDVLLKSLSALDGVTDEMKENFEKAVLPLFGSGKKK